jgi:hypothetical protein
MARSKWTRILLAVVAILMAINVVAMITSMRIPAYAQTYGKAKFMYKVVKVADDEQSIQTVTDIFSRDGWELVTYCNDILIFKK